MSEIQKMYDNITNNQARDSEYVAIALKDIVIKLEAKIDRLKAENDKLRQAMEWISVEDRLPERSSEDVITCIHYGNRHFAYEYENYYLPDTNEWANPLHKWTHWTKAILPPEVD